VPSNPKSKIQNLSNFHLWLAFISVTLIAAFFRFYHLADHPLGLFFDPAINGLDAIRLMERGGPVLFFPTNGGREALLIYLLTPFLWLFGTTPFSFRLNSPSSACSTSFSSSPSSPTRVQPPASISKYYKQQVFTTSFY
jgi:hypothetical protein